jgi:hypothetical protein
MSPLFETLAIWAAAISATFCAVSTIRMVRRIEQSRQITLAAVKEVGEAEKAAYAELAWEVDRLHKRVAKLESERATP